MIELLGNFLLVEKEAVENEKKSRGGIYLTGIEDTEEGIMKAKIVSFAEGVEGFRVGDTIFYSKQCYMMKMTIDGKAYHTILPQEIVAIERKEN